MKNFIKNTQIIRTNDPEMLSLIKKDSGYKEVSEKDYKDAINFKSSIDTIYTKEKKNNELDNYL